MKKEYFLITGGAFFVLAYVLDNLAGPVFINLTSSNPFTFLTNFYLNKYPLTAFAIVIRAIGFFIISAILSFSVKKQYFLKFVGALVVGVVSELYAVQQIATGMLTTPLQWTLSIAYAGASMTILVIIFGVAGVIFFVKQKLVGVDYDGPEEESETKNT